MCSTTITSKPRVGVDAKLKLVSSEHATTAHWTTTTNDDGLATAWSSSADINEVIKSAKAGLEPGDQAIWRLTFDKEAYDRKGKTFWPQVELRFAADQDEQHYHVPLLLALGATRHTTDHELGEKS